MVYAYLSQLIFKPLRGLHSHSRIHWPHHTLPSGAILTSWQLHYEIKAALVDYDHHVEPDLLFRLPFNTQPSNLVHFIVMTTKTDTMVVGGNEKQHYWKESLSLFSSSLLKQHSEKVRKSTRVKNEVAMTMAFMRKTLWRLREPGERAFHIRLLMCDDEAQKIVAYRTSFSLMIMLLGDESLIGLKIRLSMAKKDGFSARYVQIVGALYNQYLGTSGRLNLEWVEATQDELELMDA